MFAQSPAYVTFNGNSNTITGACNGKCTFGGKSIFIHTGSSEAVITFSICKPSAADATSGILVGHLEKDLEKCPIQLCTWHDTTEGVDKNTQDKYDVPEAGCKMSKMIVVQGDLTIKGEIGNYGYHELQSYHVDATSTHRHFELKASGKLTLKYLTLTWGGVGGTQSGGCINMWAGTLDIDGVQFDGSAIQSTVNHANYGGAIHVMNGAVTIKDSSFEGFRAFDGGAINVAVTSTAMTIESTTFKNNIADVSFSMIVFQ